MYRMYLEAGSRLKKRLINRLSLLWIEELCGYVQVVKTPLTINSSVRIPIATGALHLQRRCLITSILSI